MLTLWRMIKFGYQNFWRNIWLSVVTIVIVVLNLFLMSLVMGINIVGQQTLTAVKNKVNLSVFFTPTTSEQRASEIRQELLAKPEVKEVRMISRAEHLEQLIASQPNSNLVNEAVEALGDNPLGPGLVITARNLDEYGAITRYLDDPEFTAHIDTHGNDYITNQDVISTLSLIVNRVQGASLWLTLLFAVIAVLMVFNTIRVTIYSHREEIGIMKLVGATDGFVRGPFIVTSLMYGLLASLVTTAALLPILRLTNPFFSQFFAGYDINVLAYFQSNFFTILGLELVAGCLLAVVSSILAIGRYLRV